MCHGWCTAGMSHIAQPVDSATKHVFNVKNTTALNYLFIIEMSFVLEWLNRAISEESKQARTPPETNERERRRKYAPPFVTPINRYTGVHK